MMDRRAIVVHHDEAMSRLISSGLRVFRPGYQVATAQTLIRASDWLRDQPLDLVLVELNGHEPAQIAEWAEQNHLDTDDIVLMGVDGPRSADFRFGGNLPTAFDLSALLTLVREMNDAKESRT
jgi:hypothetical protein